MFTQSSGIAGHTCPESSSEVVRDDAIIAIVFEHQHAKHYISLSTDLESFQVRALRRGKHIV